MEHSFLNLPKDLWEVILLHMSYKNILKLYNNVKDIKIFCDENDILNKIRYLEFPRKEGHCVTHDVSFLNELPELIELIEAAKNENWYRPAIDEYIDELLHEYGNNYRDDVDEDYTNGYQYLKPLRDMFDRALDILHSRNYDLVYGDLLSFNNFRIHNKDCYGTFIFNGVEIVPLTDEYTSDWKILPPSFTVINKDVPINYWALTDEKMGVNTEVWLDITNIRNQCFDNIHVGDEGQPFTYFYYKNQIYYIYFVDHGYCDNIEQLLETSKKLFSLRKKILLDLDDKLNILNNFHDKDHTLFLDLGMYECLPIRNDLTDF